MNNSTCVGICKLTFYLFWPIFERQIIPRNLVHDEMRSYFYFHVSIEVLLILQKKLELQLHCVFSSGRPKSNKNVK